MRSLRIRLARWIAPKGFVVLLESLLPKGFGEQGFNEIRYKSEPILQDQFEPGYELREGIYQNRETPAELWRATRKELVGKDKGDETIDTKS